MIWDGTAEVLENAALGQAYRRLSLRAPEVARSARPGQFVHVLCPAGAGGAIGPPSGAPFLRRPFSLHDADPETGAVSLLFRVKGPGSAALAAVEPGKGLGVMGPLGRGVFPPPGGRPALVVAGGVGVAPLLFLAREIAAGRGSPGRGGLSVLVGIGTGADLVLAEPFRALVGRGELAVATEDGTPGTARGLVTGLLEEKLRRAGGEVPIVYACGPRPMLATVRELTRKAGAPAWFSVEERMACGVGACRGCAVPARGQPPYRLVCRDGPVFAAEELDWDRLAGPNLPARASSGAGGGGGT